MTEIATKIPRENEPDARSVISGRFHVVRELGKGGMGSVYLVEDAANYRQRLVLKVLRPLPNQEKLSETLRAEFSTLASLHHPHLVKVFDFGKLSESRYFYTMEYIKGSTFLEAIDGLPLNEILDLFHQILQALDYLHACGIYHWDLKSENILVTKSKEGRRVIKLVDFGLAVNTRNQTSVSTGGTLEYLAPELFTGALPTVQTDLYAFGVLMYWALTGEKPFDGTPKEIQQAHRNHIPTRPAEINREISSALNDAVMRLLAKDPVERFGSSEQALAAIGFETDESMNIRDSIAPRVWYAFINVCDEKIQRLNQRIRSYLQGQYELSNFFLISGNEGSGHVQIIDELKYRLQVSDVPLHEVFFQAGIGAADEPLAGAFTEFPEIESIIRNIFSEHSGDSGNDKQSFYLNQGELATRLVRLSQKRPFVIMVRNLQYADDRVLEVIYFLARSLDKHGVFICAGLTTDRASTSTTRTLARLSKSLATHNELQIQPMSESEVADLLHKAFAYSYFPSGFFREVREKSGGLPELIAAILIELNRLGYFTRSNGLFNLSEDYRLDAISLSGQETLYLNTLRALSKTQRRILIAMAVFHSAMERDFLTRIVGDSDQNLESELQQLLYRKILIALGTNGTLRFDFQSDGFRETIYQKLSDEQRLQLHSLICRSPEFRRLTSEQRAFHALNAGAVKTGLIFA